MTAVRWLPLLCLVISCVASPGSGLDGADTGDADSDVDADTDGFDPSLVTGLPCEIDDLLETRCRSCHGDPAVGAPMSLVSYDDLMAPSLADPSLRVAESALHRMLSVAAPMPPGAPRSIDAAATAAWGDWLDAGTPMGECGAAVDGGEPEPPTPTCSSGRHWDPDDDDGTPLMQPGRPCLDCHDRERLDDPDDDDIPTLIAAGTIYPSLLEPDHCMGAEDPDLVVILEGEDGVGRVELVPNSSGNFLVHAAKAPDLKPPFRVTIRRGDAERRMSIPAPHGDCNACHGATGKMGAPGRVLVP